jgi:asparagine synthase (glutamine-hydrolyzing)
VCGIAGILPLTPRDPGELRPWIERMAAAFVHRGPDESGFHVTGDVALGVRRLAVIDVANGHQPMLGQGGRLALVFNGEIYNYRAVRKQLEEAGARFTTDSDTEVVLRAWEQRGSGALGRLEGMFALAVWDGADRSLTLARDWMGQKPLYFARCAIGWAFASEIKALLTLPGVDRAPDLQALSHYMSLRYLPEDSTFFRGISKLPAATALRITASGISRRTLWRPAYEPKLQGSEPELLEELDELLSTVVGEHLMSEVPLGAFLSGGIDSSLVVAYAARASGTPLRTFSIGVHEGEHSELPWARQVARRYRTVHTEHIVEPDLAQLAPRMIAAMEEPVDPFGCGVYVVSELAAREITVALGGDGGDELFAGYDRYRGQQLAEVYSHLPRPLRHLVLRRLIRLVPDSFGYNTLASRLRWIDRMADFRGWERYAQSAAFLRFPHARKAALFTESVWREIGRAESEKLLERYFSDGCAESHLDRMLHADCMTRLADHLLTIADKMSMAHSLELRSPLLDRRIAAFAMRLPPHLKVRNRRSKYILRRLAERHLPRELSYRPKQGFSFPLALWLRGALRPMMQRVVDESRLVDAGIFRREAMQRLADEHWAGTDDHNYRLWMLFNIEIFWRHYIEGTPVEALEAWIAESTSTAASAVVVPAPVVGAVCMAADGSPVAGLRGDSSLSHPAP